MIATRHFRRALFYGKLKVNKTQVVEKRTFLVAETSQQFDVQQCTRQNRAILLWPFHLLANLLGGAQLTGGPFGDRLLRHEQCQANCPGRHGYEKPHGLACAGAEASVGRSQLLPAVRAHQFCLCKDVPLHGFLAKLTTVR